MTSREGSAAWVVVIPSNSPSGVADIVGPFESFEDAERYVHEEETPVGTWWTKLVKP